MKKRINPEEIKYISYEYSKSKMQIFNKKDFLIFDEVVTEEYFNKAGKKLFDYLESVQ